MLQIRCVLDIARTTDASIDPPRHGLTELAVKTHEGLLQQRLTNHGVLTDGPDALSEYVLIKAWRLTSAPQMWVNTPEVHKTAYWIS